MSVAIQTDGDLGKLSGAGRWSSSMALEDSMWLRSDIERIEHEAQNCFDAKGKEAVP
jgi:hypothetical protein